jgi:hypothetical protein
MSHLQIFKSQDELTEHISMLRKEVGVLKTRLRPAGTGYLHTAIDVINGRIDELIGSAIDAQPDKIRDLTSKIFEEEDVYDGYEEHTEAMEQSRLREIQNKAAGRPNMTEKDREKFDSQPNEVRDAYLYSSRVKDEVEHTDDYYDTERNRPVDEGLSDRSQFLRTMKRKHGQAVMTTSEMMQEELEPLPINTFE